MIPESLRMALSGPGFDGLAIDRNSRCIHPLFAAGIAGQLSACDKSIRCG